MQFSYITQLHCKQSAILLKPNSYIYMDHIGRTISVCSITNIPLDTLYQEALTLNCVKKTNSNLIARAPTAQNFTQTSTEIFERDKIKEQKNSTHFEFEAYEITSIPLNHHSVLSLPKMLYASN